MKEQQHEHHSAEIDAQRRDRLQEQQEQCGTDIGYNRVQEMREQEHERCSAEDPEIVDYSMYELREG